MKKQTEDVFWCLSQLLPDKLQREAACQFAESVLPIYEREYPDDNRPRAAIEAGRAYYRGEIGEDVLSAAWDAAANAALDATGHAIKVAAWTATRAAAGAAAFNLDAPRAAAGAAEEQKQIKILLKLHREMNK